MTGFDDIGAGVASQSVHDLFLVHLHLYLVQSGCSQSAGALLKETRLQFNSTGNDAFFFEWWCLLWSLHSSAKYLDASLMPPPSAPGRFNGMPQVPENQQRMSNHGSSTNLNGLNMAQPAPPSQPRPQNIQQPQQLLQNVPQNMNNMTIPNSAPLHQNQPLPPQTNLSQQLPIMLPGHQPLMVHKNTVSKPISQGYQKAPERTQMQH